MHAPQLTPPLTSHSFPPCVSNYQMTGDGRPGGDAAGAGAAGPPPALPQRHARPPGMHIMPYHLAPYLAPYLDPYLAPYQRHARPPGTPCHTGPIIQRPM
jgi:hypothetical protein